MLRTTIAFAACIAACKVAAAQPASLSYYSGSCTADTPCEIVSALPASGFVLTDVFTGTQGTPMGLRMSEVTGAQSVTKSEFYLSAGGLHLNSGIPFAGGDGIRLEVFDNGTSSLMRITLVGYIPTASVGSVPAVSGWGLFALLLSLAVAGTVFLNRRRIAGPTV